MNRRREIVGERDDQALKSCCANMYQSEWVRLLLGDSFHPGGTALTGYLGAALHLGPGQRVLDVAAGQGTSAIHLAQCFGCTVQGIEYSRVAVERATQAARSTFPNKAMAASEFVRVLSPGGRVGLSDLTRTGEIPAELRGLLAWIACIADAQPLENYMCYLTDVGLTIQLVEQHDEALSDMVRDIQAKLLGTELLVKLKKITLPGEIDVEQAKTMVKAAATAIQARQFGYAVVTATKS